MTAEEILVINNVFGVIGTDVKFNLNLSRDCYIATQHNIKRAMQDYAKLKCQELLKIAAEKAKIIENRSMSSGYDYTERYVCKNSIINAVDLNEFIK